jgi:glycosyltransferase XagB
MEFTIYILNFLIIIQCFFTIIKMTYAWESEETILEHKLPDQFLEPKNTFTVLLPVKNEELVIKDTTTALATLNYPKHLYEVLILANPSDKETIRIAQETINKNHFNNTRVVIVDSFPEGKSPSMNYGLKVAKGNLITIFDAEDEPSAEILNIANTIFENKNCDLLQCGVQLMNYNAKWYSLICVLEYFFWFKSALLYYSKHNVMPLGGNTIFIKKSKLEEVGGWDVNCLTEDADLGIRLAQNNINLAVCYDAKHCTREEAPENVKSYIKQRTRWIQGFFQIFKKGDWLNLGSFKKSLIALYFLFWPFLQIFIFIYLILSLFIFPFLNLSLTLSIFSIIPLLMLIIQLILLNIGIYLFTQEYNLKYYFYLPFKLFITFIPYQVILSIASIRALYREFSGIKYWEKTVHYNVHRTSDSNNKQHVMNIPVLEVLPEPAPPKF